MLLSLPTMHSIRVCCMTLMVYTYSAPIYWSVEWFGCIDRWVVVCSSCGGGGDGDGRGWQGSDVGGVGYRGRQGE